MRRPAEVSLRVPRSGGNRVGNGLGVGHLTEGPSRVVRRGQMCRSRWETTIWISIGNRRVPFIVVRKPEVRPELGSGRR